MRDLNDPTLLGEHILKMTSNGMKATDAADLTYEDQYNNGWRFGPGRSLPERPGPASENTDPSRESV